MHPFLLELWGFRLPTYGVLSVCALAAAVLLVRRYARIEKLDVDRTTEAIVLTIAVGYFGARLFEAVLHWDRYFGPPGGLKLLMLSTGIFLGGLIAAIPFCVLWFRHIGLPVLQGLDLLALAGCVAEGVGRWGCFFSGCCYGTPTNLPWAVTFPDIARRLHAGLPGVPIHPTQIYMSMDAFLILGVLLLLYRRKRFHGQIMTVYVLLYTLTRFFIEFVRGDADRGFAFGGRISTSQLLGIVLAIVAAASYFYLDARHRKAIVAAALAILAITGSRSSYAAPSSVNGGFRVRMVKAGGDPADRATLDHVRFCRKQGFNALWVYSHEAGEWTKERAPDGPTLTPAFLHLARWCRWHKMDLWVSLNPPGDTNGDFVYSDPDDEHRLVAFIALLRKKAGVRRIVLSFDDVPLELRELSDIFRYGLSTAPAQLDLVRRVAAGSPPDVAFWLCSSAYCDAHLAKGEGAYSKPFLAGLASLPTAIGIVWTGPKVLSPTITRQDLEATRARLGGRPLLLYDNFPVNDDQNDTMALILGALRGREAGIRDVVSAYLACPERPLAGSRLSLFTIADFLRDPEGYDPDAATRSAIAKLAGAGRDAETALTTQQLEWGGFIEGRNYWPRDEMNPVAAAGRLRDPAFVESFTWTASRYPGRMEALGGVADAPFRSDLLKIMRRRLVIAKAMPLTVDYLARVRAGRADADVPLAAIGELRKVEAGDADAERILDLFLGEAGVPLKEHP